MNLKTMTQQLLEHGYSQASLARAVSNTGVSCSQPTIWRILNDTDPSYSVGEAIRKLHIEVVGTEAA